MFIQMALKYVSIDLHALRLQNLSPLEIHMLILHSHKEEAIVGLHR